MPFCVHQNLSLYSLSLFPSNYSIAVTLVCRWKLWILPGIVRNTLVSPVLSGIIVALGMLLGKIGGKKVTTKTKRWYKDIGLGFKTPSGELALPIATGLERRMRGKTG